MEGLESLGGWKFRDVRNCRECAYLDDCKEFWMYCPYDGRVAVEKRRDDAEVF